MSAKASANLQYLFNYLKLIFHLLYHLLTVYYKITSKRNDITNDNDTVIPVRNLCNLSNSDFLHFGLLF